MLPWLEYSHFAISLFAILTPFAAVPAYLSFTKECTAWERSHTAILAAGTAALVLIITALMGPVILGALGVSLGSLRVGGGLVLLLTALSSRILAMRRSGARAGIIPPARSCRSACRCSPDPDPSAR